MTLIGATTENPYFELNSALLSRMQVYELEALTAEELREIVRRGAEELGVALDPEVEELIAARAGGDGRGALGILELAVQTAGAGPVETAHVEDAARKRPLSTTGPATATTTRSRPGSSRPARATCRRRSTTSRSCSRAARIRASSPAG